jgi:polyhydroxyalkanoate synthesis regulator phasin
MVAMKSLILRSVYAGLGLAGNGKNAVEQFGDRLARQAKLSEKDGEKIAHRLQARSDKAITTVHHLVEKEITKVVNALHAAARSDVKKMTAKTSRHTRRPRHHKRHQKTA